MEQRPAETPAMRAAEERVGQPLRSYLLDAYFVRRMTLDAIGAEVGRDKATVSRWFGALGIPARRSGWKRPGRTE